nr:hypothetical protein [Patescibacteria group bacterium]
LLGIGALFLAWSADHKAIHPVFALLMTGWALATHPLAGLPFAALVIGVLWIRLVQRKEWRPWIGWVGSGLSALATAVCVPLAFILQSLVSKTQVSWHTDQLLQFSTWWRTLIQGVSPPISHLALWPDWADTIQWIIPFFLILGAVIAYFTERRERVLVVHSGLASAGLCLAGAIMAQAGEFSFLINYERSNYADRLFLVAGLVLIPAALLGWAHTWERIRSAPPILICFWVVFLSALSTGAVYGALPRHDAGMIGHGWSVGQADMESVKFIEKDAQGKPYTVLANQSVSAAAVANFGFKRYVGDVFYYPLPTGGPLYQLFLNVTATPSLEPIQEAAQLGESSLVYIVLNAYWWNAEQVQESLKALSSRAWSVRDGEAYIFRFDVSTSTKR